MSWKIFAFLLFLVVVTFIVFISYHNSLDTTIEISDSDNIYIDILEMTPSQTFRLTLKNTEPEIKALSFLLFLVFVVAMMSARFEIVSNITKETVNKTLALILEKRTERIALIAEKQRLKSKHTIDGKSPIETVIDQLEKSIAAKNSPKP